MLRGREFTLTVEEYDRLRTGACYYCHGHLARIPGVGGLDRIDNTKGYTIDNVLPCCAICNVTRGNRFTVEETVVMIAALVKHRNRRPRLKVA